MRTRNGDLNVQTSGSGRPFVWGHGLMFSMAMEDALGLVDYAQLAEQADARIVRYDARGHGASPGTETVADYHWPALAQDMLAVADALEIDRFVAGGQSMGAATSLCAALAAPERVEALVLENPPVVWEARAAQAALYEQMAALVENKGIAVLRTMFEARPSSPPWLWEWSSKSGRPGHIARALDFVEPRTLPFVLRGAGQTNLPSRAALRALTVPTLILAWADDPMHPVAAAQALADHLPNARLEVAHDPTDVLGWSQLIRDFVRPH